MRTVVIIEPDHDGHHLVYVSALIDELLKRGRKVRLLTAPPEVSMIGSRWEILEKEYQGKIEINWLKPVVLPAKGNRIKALIKSQIQQFNSIKDAFAGMVLKDTIIYHNSFDTCSRLVALLGSPFHAYPFVGMTLTTSFHRRSMGAIVPNRLRHLVDRWLFHKILNLGGLKAICTIDETLAGFAAMQRSESWEKVHHVPDIANLQGSIERSEARRRLKISADQIAILVYGMITQRKGICELLEAMSLIRDERMLILIAGPQEKQIKLEIGKFLASGKFKQGQVLIIDELLHGEEECAVFKASDIVWLGYKGFSGMSAVLLQAGLMGLPIIACFEGVIGLLTAKHKLGITVDPSNKSEVAQAITTLADEPSLRREFGSNGLQLAKNHSREKFSQTICDLFDNCMDWQTDKIV